MTVDHSFLLKSLPSPPALSSLCRQNRANLQGAREGGGDSFINKERDIQINSKAASGQRGKWIFNRKWKLWAWLSCDRRPDLNPFNLLYPCNIEQHHPDAVFHKTGSKSLGD